MNHYSLAECRAEANAICFNDRFEHGPDCLLCGNRSTRPGSIYIDLLRRTLTNWIYRLEEETLLKAAIGDQHESNPHAVALGAADWNQPYLMHTMIGMERLDNIKYCFDMCMEDGIPGDLVECGVWRGGATIWMRGLLKDQGITDRDVWVVDSFQGVTPADLVTYPQDTPIRGLCESVLLAIPQDRVRTNFESYGLLDEQVHFLEGWFADTLPGPLGDIAVLRLDGDLYKSTMETLNALYSHVSPGGYVIIDDYFCIAACGEAVDDFRRANDITETLHQADFTAAYWRKP